jgi:hypothetical protein
MIYHDINNVSNIRYVALIVVGFHVFEFLQEAVNYQNL